jgi:hypothetical protein
MRLIILPKRFGRRKPSQRNSQRRKGASNSGNGTARKTARKPVAVKSAIAHKGSAFGLVHLPSSLKQQNIEFI